MRVLDVEAPRASAWRLGVGWEYAKELMPREMALPVIPQIAGRCTFIVANPAGDGSAVAGEELVGVHFPGQ